MERAGKIARPLLRNMNWLLARMLGALVMAITRVLRHKSETLRIQTLDCNVRVTYSDMAGEQGFEEWVATFHSITLEAMCLLAKSGASHGLGSHSARAIWIVRGGKGKSRLLGRVFVFSPPKADDRTILKFFFHDMVWLARRNECYYQENLPIVECEREATRLAKEVLVGFE